jgi:hypothetical protein
MHRMKPPTTRAVTPANCDPYCSAHWCASATSCSSRAGPSRREGKSRVKSRLMILTCSAFPSGFKACAGSVKALARRQRTRFNASAAGMLRIAVPFR